MNRRPLALCAALALTLMPACGDKDDGGAADTGAAADGADGGDGTDGTDEPQVYPSGDRVLLYYGHGGYGPEASGKAAFETIDAWWNLTYDWNTDHRESWTEDLGEYRMVGFLAPGSTDDATFSDDEIATLVAALDNGTRIVVFGDRSGCASPGPAALLTALGSTMSFTGDAAGANAVVQADDFNRSQQIGAELEDPIRMKEPCFVDPTGGNAVVRDGSNNVLVASQPIGSGGDVVLVGDFQFLDDASGYLESGDTQQLADNLAIVEPGWTPGGGDTGAGR